MKLGSIVQPMSGLIPNAVSKQLDKFLVPPIPESILGEVPVVWAYVRLDEDLYALVRTCNIGFTDEKPTPRPGNFFAHALVFPPAALEPFAGNPLRLTRSSLFRTRDDLSSTDLPALTSLGNGATPGPRRVLTQRAYQSQVVSMVTALGQLIESPKRLLFCVPQWQDGASLLEELLDLLPPSSRSRIPFCTYAGRDAKLGAETGPDAPPTMSVCLVAGSRETVDNMKIQETDFGAHSTRIIFNFLENRFSNLGKAGVYAELAAQCVGGQAPALAHHHKITELLGQGLNPKAWDDLVRAVPLLTDRPRVEEVSDGLKAAGAWVKDADRVQTLLGWLLPCVRSYAQQNNGVALQTFAVQVPRLANMLKGAGGSGVRPTFIAELFQLATASLKEGKGVTGGALLALAGDFRVDLLPEAVRSLIPPPRASVAMRQDGRDREPLMDILLDTADTLCRPPSPANEFHRVLIAAFRLARDARLMDQAWAHAGESIVKPLFRARWDEDQKRTAAVLADLSPRMKGLSLLHSVMEQLGMADQPGTVWEKSEPAASLLNGGADAEALASGTRALAPLIDECICHDGIRVAQTVSGWLVPHLGRLASANDFTGVGRLAASISDLMAGHSAGQTGQPSRTVPTSRTAADVPESTRSGRGAPDWPKSSVPLPGATAGSSRQAGSNPWQVLLDEVRSQSGRALTDGHVRTVQALLRCAGRDEETMRLDLLERVLRGPNGQLRIPQDPDEHEPLLSFLVVAIETADKSSTRRGALDSLLGAAFESAKATQQTASLWDRIGKGIVLKRLEDGTRRDLARRLLTSVSVQDSPDAYFWLQLRELEAAPRRDDELLPLVGQLAAAATRSPREEECIERLIQTAARLLPDPGNQVLALACMAEHAQEGQGRARRMLLRAFSDTMRRISQPEERDRVHAELRNADVLWIVCQEILGEMIPWDEMKGPALLRRSGALSDRRLQASLCRSLADRLHQAGDKAGVLPAANAMLPERPRKEEDGAEILALYGAVVVALPLSPLSASWQRKLSPPPARLPEAAQARFRILSLMEEVKNAAEKTGWTIADFPKESDVWRRDVGGLRPEEKAQVRSWLMDLLRGAELKTPSYVRTLDALLETMGITTVEGVADTLKALMSGYSPVEIVNVVTAVADCAIEGGRNEDAFVRLFRCLEQGLPRATRALLREHLSEPGKRGGIRLTNYANRVRHVYESGELSDSRRASAEVREEEGDDGGTQEGRKGGTVGKVSRWIGRFLGKDEEEERDLGRDDESSRDGRGSPTRGGRQAPDEHRNRGTFRPPSSL
jgi:hypothetical protein